jgi:NAD(P)-dependent dehydrogenase (short-subunit alcohol dehydrogenase family)
MLRDRQIVLAGGSGGIGSAAAGLLAGEGARLVISYFRNAARAEAWRTRAAVVQADLTQAADRARLLDAGPELYG